MERLSSFSQVQTAPSRWCYMSMYKGALVKTKLVALDKDEEQDKYADLEIVVVKPVLLLDKDSIRIEFRSSSCVARTYDEERVQDIRGYSDEQLADFSQFIIQGEKKEFKSLDWVNAMSVEQIRSDTHSSSSYHMLNQNVQTIYLGMGISYQEHFNDKRAMYYAGLESICGKDPKVSDLRGELKDFLLDKISEARLQGRFEFVKKIHGLSEDHLVEELLPNITCYYRG